MQPLKQVLYQIDESGSGRMSYHDFYVRPTCTNQSGMIWDILQCWLCHFPRNLSHDVTEETKACCTRAHILTSHHLCVHHKAF